MRTPDGASNKPKLSDAFAHAQLPLTSGFLAVTYKKLCENIKYVKLVECLNSHKKRKKH